VALKKLPFRTVKVLLKQHLSAEEDTKTAALIRELRPARARGYLTREELGVQLEISTRDSPH
jgi:hypothetical protein